MSIKYITGVKVVFYGMKLNEERKQKKVKFAEIFIEGDYLEHNLQACKLMKKENNFLRIFIRGFDLLIIVKVVVGYLTWIE